MELGEKQKPQKKVWDGLKGGPFTSPHPHTEKAYRIQVGSDFGVIDDTLCCNAPASMATRGTIAFPCTSRSLHALM